MASFERCVVLVADDEPSVLRTVTFSLERHGYVVIPAGDGQQALRACHESQSPIHLAVLDVMMPGMTGPELFECLHEIHPKLEVLFMSGYNPANLSGISPDLYQANFIAKPFLPRALVHRVNQILGNEDVCTLVDAEASHA